MRPAEVLPTTQWVERALPAVVHALAAVNAGGEVEREQAGDNAAGLALGDFEATLHEV